MKNSIKRSVSIRVVATLSATLLLSFLTSFNIFRIQTTQAETDRKSVV